MKNEDRTKEIIESVRWAGECAQKYGNYGPRDFELCTQYIEAMDKVLKLFYHEASWRRLYYTQIDAALDELKELGWTEGE